MIIRRMRMMRFCDQRETGIELIRQRQPFSGVTHTKHLKRLPIDGRIGGVWQEHVKLVEMRQHICVEQRMDEIDLFRRYQLAIFVKGRD